MIKIKAQFVLSYIFEMFQCQKRKTHTKFVIDLRKLLGSTNNSTWADSYNT